MKPATMTAQPSAAAKIWTGMAALAKRLVTAEKALALQADHAGRLADAEARIAALEARLNQ